MSMKKTDLERLAGLKLDRAMRGKAAPARFGAAAAALPDRTAQRKLDAAAGLVPCACKLPAALTEQLRERAAGHEGGINALVADLLAKGLKA